ncbi:hypothetical protein VNO80_27591 [Phaseolus coccineus]|uniref:Uncharacterized protein n=1 Tax=Phaseolus coccineus TaxID=3886 RepID=A0AAN9QLD8_PHACN
MSSSKESLLCDLSVGAHSHHSPSTSPASANSPPHSNAIFMVSPPDSQDPVPQDVSHTSPGNTSIPSFCEQPWVAPEGDVDAGKPGFVDLCEGSEFVDLGMDSVLGFSEVQLTQEMGVDECSHGARRYVLGEIRDGRFDEFAVFDRELSEMDKTPGKKPELSEGDLGIDSSGGCVEVQSQKVREGVGNLVSEEEKISDEKNCCAENLEILVGNVGLCESEKVACIVEGSKSSDGIVEDSGMQKKSDEERALPVLPPSMRGPLKIAASESECLKNAASGVVFGNSREKKDVFDVLRVLSEISNEEEKNLDDISLIEVAEAFGITFPRPRWWPEGENFDP